MEEPKMKWLLLILLILGLFTSYGYAQMAGQNAEMSRGMMDWGYGIGGVGLILITLLAIVLILGIVYLIRSRSNLPESRGSSGERRREKDP